MYIYIYTYYACIYVCVDIHIYSLTGFMATLHVLTDHLSSVLIGLCFVCMYVHACTCVCMCIHAHTMHMFMYVCDMHIYPFKDFVFISHLLPEHMPSM